MDGSASAHRREPAGDRELVGGDPELVGGDPELVGGDRELVGRDPELARLRLILAETVAGAGGCVVLTGPPGIGKTRVLRETLRHAPMVGLATAAGRATELDRVAPLTTLVSALQRGQPEPVDLRGLKDHDGDRFWYIDRLGEALEAYVAHRPLLVVIDDAQWTDEFSALALRALVSELSSAPVRWLLARRPVPARSAAQDTIDRLVEEGAQQITLGPLDEAAVGRLCSDILGATADATVMQLAARGGGNPFLLEQLLSALWSADQVLVSDGIATVVGGELPSSFLATVEQRLRGLSAEARALLQAGAVFGRSFTIHAAAQLAGRRPTDLLPAAEEAVAAGVLVERDERLAFCHDLWREAFYTNMSGPVRSALHREAAEVVRAEGRSVVEIADHLTRSGSTGDREAAEVLRAAAAQVAGRAPGTAADLIMRALEMVGEHDPARPGLSAYAVGLLASAGRLGEARELGEAALHSGLDVTTEATLMHGLAEAFKHAGQNQMAVDYARRALDRAGVPDPIRASLYAVSAHALLYVDDMAGADRAGEEADRLGQATGEFGASVFGRAARSVVARADGRLDDALAHARHAADTAERVGGEAAHRHPGIWLGGALVALDRFAEAERVYTEGRREAERLGTAWSYPLWHFYLATLQVANGRLDEADAVAEAGLRIAEQTAHQLSVPLLGLLTRVAIRRAQMPVARDHLRRLRRLLADGITAAPEDVTWAFAAFEEADGKPLVAVSTLADLYDRLPERLFLLSNDPGCAPTLVRLALKAGQPARAEATVAAARILADRNPSVPSLAGAAAQAEGLLRQDLDALRDAVEYFRKSPRPLARASAMEDAAIAEHAAGHRPRAVELLEEAIDECATRGARRATVRLERRLRLLGQRRRAAAPEAPAGSTLGGLTEAELRVALLVAKGLTNREVAEQLFLSVHTVDSHLRHIFGKFGIRSRVELARIVASRGE